MAYRPVAFGEVVPVQVSEPPQIKWQLLICMYVHVMYTVFYWLDSW